MEVIRQLLFRAAAGGYDVVIRHVPGVENGPADALSRGDVGRFRQLQPSAADRPTPLPDRWAECVADPLGAASVMTHVRL